MTDPQPPKPRSRRIYVMWSVALSLLLALGLFCWLVVVPVLKVRGEAKEFLASGLRRDYISSQKAASPYIQRLGGPRNAARRLAEFLRMPQWVTGPGRTGEHKRVACILLAYCETPGLAELVALLENGDELEQSCAVYGLMVFAINYKQPTADDLLKGLANALDDKDPEVRQLVVRAIELVKSTHENPLLPKLAGRAAVAKELKKIKAAQEQQP